MTDNQQVKVALLTYPDPPDLHPGERSWREFARWVVGVVAAGPCGEPDRHEIFAVWWAERLRQVTNGSYNLAFPATSATPAASRLQADTDRALAIITGETGTPPAITNPLPALRTTDS